MHKKKYLILILILTAAFTINAQPVLPLDFTEQNEYKLTDNLYILEDVNGDYSPSDIFLGKYDSLFQKNKNSELRFGFNQSVYWVRFSLINKSILGKPIILELKNSTINRLQLFSFHHSSVFYTDETGDALPFHTRRSGDRNFIYELFLVSGKEYVFLMKIKSEGDALNIPVNIYSYNVYNNKIGQERLLYGVFYGVIFTVLITTLIFFFYFKNKHSLLYLDFVTLLGLLNFQMDGLAFQYLWPNMPGMNNQMLYILPILTSVFTLLFADAYLNLKKNLPFFRKIIFVLIIVNFCSFLLTFTGISVQYKIYLTFVIAGISTIIAILTGVLNLKHDRIVSLHFLSAFFALFLSIALISTSILGGLFPSIIREYSLKIGMSLQLILLTVALFVKIKMLLEESHQKAIRHLQELNEMKEEMNVELENKVQERTKQLTEANIKVNAAFEDIKIINAQLGQKNEEIRTQCDEIQSQVELVRSQKEILELQKSEITDSISYAKYLQVSVFPPKGLLDKFVTDHFILYKPKSIVSGDFYWVKEVADFGGSNASANQLFIAAVDCTGHGVPGAFLSIIAGNSMNRASELFDKPSDILSYVNRDIFRTLHHKNKETYLHDGVNIALCKIDYNAMTLDFSGAYHPFVIFQNGMMNVHKGERLSLGSDEKDQSAVFKNYSLEIAKGDTFYLFSDGYSDQFSEKNNKKYKTKSFLNLLATIQNSSMTEQHQALEKHLAEWMGTVEQVDDILVVGIRV